MIPDEWCDDDISGPDVTAHGDDVIFCKRGHAVQIVFLFNED
jgi:hypothetical protein